MTHLRFNSAAALVGLALLAPALSFADTCDNSGNLTNSSGIVVGTCTPASGDPTTNVTDPYAFRRQGVFGCSLNGSYSMSVGALSAVGGVYVPVNDAAVTLNTGYLVYKECVLRGVVDRQRENVSATLQRQQINTYAKGRDGQPYFSTDRKGERVEEADRVTLLSLQNGTLGTLNPAFKQPVTRAIAQGYMAGRNSPNKAFYCPYKGNLQTSLKGSPDVPFWDAIDAASNPACRPGGAYMLADSQVDAYRNAALNDMDTRLMWDNGNYGVQKVDDQGNIIVVTPGSIVGANALQALQTGFVQLQNANDIDQMVGALFAGITSQAIGDNRGLLGLLQPTGSKPSYLDQVVAESAQGLRDSAANAALQILNAAKQVELAYKQYMTDIGTLLANTAASLRAKESACWDLIIQKVCQDTPNAQKQCTAVPDGCTTDPATGIQTCPASYKLQVATSTAFSLAVINARIIPLASTTANNIQKANDSIKLIDTLIAGVSNSASIDAQRVALQQLDTLVSQRALHNQYDLQAAAKAKDDVSASMDTLMTDTVKAWAESTDPNTGWCNVNNVPTLNYWKAKWKI